MWQTYVQPTDIEEAVELLEQYAGKARLVAGGTDVLVELQRGVKPTTTLIDITALRDLKYIREENGYILLGALTTHNDVIASSSGDRLLVLLNSYHISRNESNVLQYKDPSLYIERC